jgi:hypothetical protein
MLALEPRVNTLKMSMLNLEFVHDHPEAMEAQIGGLEIRTGVMEAFSLSCFYGGHEGCLGCAPCHNHLQIWLENRISRNSP